jgi:hypothetical protein
LRRPVRSRRTGILKQFVTSMSDPAKKRTSVDYGILVDKARLVRSGTSPGIEPGTFGLSDRLRKLLSHHVLSMTSRTFLASANGVYGFPMNDTPSNRTPWCTIASSVYPDMNRTFISG